MVDYEDIILLSRENFSNLASNAIQRINKKDEEILNDNIGEIIKINNIYELMKSYYENYVIQKAIKFIKGNIKINLFYQPKRGKLVK